MEEKERAGRDKRREAVENELREIQEQLMRRERESQELRQRAEKLRASMGPSGPGDRRREERREMRVEVRKAEGPGGETRMEGFFIGPDGKRQEIRGMGGAGGFGPGGPNVMVFGQPGMGGPGGPMGPGGPSAMRGLEERLSKLERNVERLIDQSEKQNRPGDKRRD